MTPDLRLYELFLRYWDNVLSFEEAQELGNLLANDPLTCDRFHLFTLQAIAAAELPKAPLPLQPHSAPKASGSVVLVPEAVPAAVATISRGVSRRRMMSYLGGGLAVGIGGVAFVRWAGLGDSSRNPRLSNVQGTVLVHDQFGKSVSLDRTLPAGATITTYGLASSAVLVYPNGAGVTLTGDSAIKLTEQQRGVLLHRGAISATIPELATGEEALVLQTTQVSFVGKRGVMMSLSSGLRRTEALVHLGMAAATRPTGASFTVVKQGESLTVWQDGEHKKQPIAPTPEAYRWDLDQPLPEGWTVGRRELTNDRQFVVSPELWPDPYYQNTEMYQIRSDKQWLHGFFAAQPGTLLRVRYWVDRPGAGQLCICVRTMQSRSPETGMLEWNGNYGSTGVGSWQWLELRTDEMIPPAHKHPPKFPTPWIGFLFIFNTYTIDLGLKIAEFQVTRAGAAAPGK